MDLREKIKNLSPEQLNLLLARAKKTGGIGNTTQMPRKIDQRFPLSYGQQRIWFQSELETGEAAFNNAVAFVVSVMQPLDLHVLKNTVNEVIQKNEILRTVFDSEGGQPFQRILKGVWIDVNYVDLRSVAIEQRMSKTTELAEQEASKPFDLKNGPLVRFSVFQTRDLEYVFLTVCHHLISDGWSNNLFFMEMTKGLFLVAKENLPVPQYLEFVSWEKTRFQGELVERLLNFWKAYLSGDLPRTRFPQENVKESQVENQCSQKSRLIEGKLARKVRQFSKHQKTTLFVLLLAAFKALLFRYTGAKDLMIGLPFANRFLPEFQKTMGLFINLIPLRTQIDGMETFLDYVKSVDSTTRQVIFQKPVKIF